MVAQSIKNGSVVKIPTAILFEEWAEMLEQLAYNIHPQCYGVVKKYSTRGGYTVHWAIRGMFDLVHDSTDEINEEREYEEIDLTVFRRHDDCTIGDYYLHNYFVWNEELAEWTLDNTPIVCGICMEDSTDERDCVRSNTYLQEPMAHLYFDLLQECNEHLSNKEKRFICYRWWTKVKYGHLGMGNRKPVHPCVQKEITNWFPHAEGEEAVGFRYVRRSAD